MLFSIIAKGINNVDYKKCCTLFLPIVFNTANGFGCVAVNGDLRLLCKQALFNSLIIRLPDSTNQKSALYLHPNTGIMSANNEVNSFILKVGAVIGLSFAATIFIANLRGMTHIPGDNISWLNIIIFMFVVMISGRQYRETVEGDKFVFGRAYLYITKLNLISSLILAVFGYFYYTSIAPGDIDEIIILINNMFAEMEQAGKLTAEQSGTLIEIYKQTLSGGSMAVVMFFYQLFRAAFFGLFLAIIIKTKKNISITILNNEH